MTLLPKRAVGIMLSAGLALAAAISPGTSAEVARKRVVLIAGPASHTFAEHEHYAGLKLLGDMLNERAPAVQASVYQGWPEDPAALADAAAIVVYADGGDDGLLTSHLAQLEAPMKRGAGLGVMHWALDVPKGEPGTRLMGWIGGCFETNWSVNPKWTAVFAGVPAHPVTRGVRPFALEDEWYYHMRFVDGMRGVTPLLSAVPPDVAHDGPDSPYAGNPVVRARKGQMEHLVWVFERPGGGRGFGFCGGHRQWNWGQDDFRKIALNAIVWVAGAEVPADGVETPRPGAAQLMRNFGKPVPKKINVERFDRMLAEMNSQPAPAPRQ